MSRICSLFLTSGKVTPEVFFKACLLRAKKGIGDTHQADVMMPAQPLTPFVMIQSQFFFQFAVIQLHAPAGLGDAYQPPQSQRLGAELSQPVFDGLLGILRPFHQQPLRYARRMFPFSPAVSRPDRRSEEARPLRS